MKNWIYRLIIGLVLTVPLSIFAEEKYETFLREILNLREDKIDICELSFDLAKDANPDLKKEKYLARLDDMAEKIKFISMNSTVPHQRINALVSYIHEVSETEFDKEDPSGKVSRTHYLYQTLDSKKGNFKTMPALYLCLAQKLNYPIYYTKLPGHVILKYHAPPSRDINIELTAPVSYSDQKYIEEFNIPHKAIEVGVFMRPLSHREYLGELLANVAAYWFSKGELMRGMRYMETASKLSPSSVAIINSLADMYKRYDAISQETQQPSKYQKEVVGPEYLKRSKYYHGVGEKLQKGIVPKELHKRAIASEKLM